MNVLGINSYTHDVSAGLVGDRGPLLLLEEERFSRVRHHDGFVFGGGPPTAALRSCLDACENDVGTFAHARAIDHSAARHNIPQERLLAFAEALDPGLRKTRFIDHHTCHAASAFFTSGFGRAYVCTMDSRGDGISLTVSVGDKDKLARIIEVSANASICRVYSYVSELLGLGRRNEGSMMALAGLSEPDQTLPKFASWTGYGFAIETDGIAAAARQAISLRDKSRIAATVQSQLEEAVVTLLGEVCTDSSIVDIALAGGGFLNCTLNERLATCGRWRSVYVVPAPGDSGLALGAAILCLPNPSGFTMKHSYWGTSVAQDHTVERFQKYRVRGRRANLAEVAELISRGKVGGFLTGAMEFGPRALGHRSIIGDPRNPEASRKINIIKKRQPWRPVSPAILHTQGAELVQEYQWSPYMSRAFKSKPGISSIRAAVHIDGSCRLQSVISGSGMFSDLLDEFYSLTGAPAMLNTSFNIQSPIVRTLEDGLAAYFTSPLEFFYCEGILLEKD